MISDKSINKKRRDCAMRTWVICFIIFIFTSCAIERPKGKTEAEILFKEAQELIDSERYILASEKLNQLRSRYPYSYFATPAELLLSDILFMQESYVEAASSYLLFKDLHPNHEKIPYVISRIAESYFNQIPSTFDRDLMPAKEAIKYYQEILSYYPNSPEFKNAKDKIEKCKKLLSQKEEYIADFYFKTEVYEAAGYRYKILLNMPRVESQTRLKAMKRYLISYTKSKAPSKCMSEFPTWVTADYTLLERQELDSLYNKCVSVKLKEINE